MKKMNAVARRSPLASYQRERLSLFTDRTHGMDRINTVVRDDVCKAKYVHTYGYV